MRATAYGILGVLFVRGAFELIGSPFHVDKPIDIGMIFCIFITCAASQLIKQAKE